MIAGNIRTLRHRPFGKCSDQSGGLPTTKEYEQECRPPDKYRNDNDQFKTGKRIIIACYTPIVNTQIPSPFFPFTLSMPASHISPE